ncbi:molybdate ABC transporter substrate-binding protein [Methanosarcina sp. KYL-1]|uniref:molybdate ABC transporter substrate-binding protein n=1 Tax=Methanosarcina sp. KYL-1 TaxID=2602068 RepID=UPI002100B9FE|nr:molybdate ABC transporter substrate-binding protein [Methanosarcina sp. KYL-1]MCQ1534451.1 molybdate ABC transporter substrate-binding protein [Methanosarcina sp. KYL-1]
MDETKIKKLILPIIAAVICLGIVVFLAASPETEEEQPTIITVSAAASLTEAFTDIAEEFEAAKPGTDVELNFAGSGTLRMQIEGGAPIDVFASASESHMDILSEKGLIEERSRKDFTSNTLVMVVPEDSIESGTYPASLEDLTEGSVEKIAIGNPETAPVGKYTEQALEETGLRDEIEGKVILAENVKQVLTYVETGEVEAGFVYRTDAESGQKDLYKITYTVPVNASISYPIAVLSESGNKETAQEFVDFVTGQQGQEILEGYGFGITKI